MGGCRCLAVGDRHERSVKKSMSSSQEEGTWDGVKRMLSGGVGMRHSALENVRLIGIL
jgi:hypothetical protein